MKKILLVFINIYCFTSLLSAQTSGSLTVSVTTSNAGGNYAPRNVIAIWIEDNSGKFVKTLLAYANSRRTHLNNWETTSTSAGVAFNTVDAVSGATQNSHGTRTCSWNGTDFSGKLVADGEFKLRMELTDKNSTGNISSFSFTKGSSNLILNPANVPSFSSISLSWKPTTTDVNTINSDEIINIFPNPGKNIFKIAANDFISYEVISISGKLVSKGKLPEIDLSKNTPGIYLVNIITDEKTYVRKIIKE